MKRLIISIVLFSIGLGFWLKHINSVSGIQSLNTNHDSQTLTSAIIDLDSQPIISGEFKAKFQNLNKVSLRLYIPNEFKRGTIIFRLKKVGQDHWYFENNYYVESVAKNDKATFSFPAIADSRGSNYRFEVEYIGDYASGRIVIKSGDYAYTSSYDFFRNSQLNQKLVYVFFTSKVSEVSKIPGIFIYFLMAFTPFFVYLFSATKKIPGFLTILTCVFIISDVITTHLDIDIATVMVALMWILMIIEGRLDYEIPAIISLIPLILLASLDFLGSSAKSSEAASWTYIFLSITVLGFIQSSLNQKARTIGLNQLLKHFVVEYGVLEIIIKKVPPLIYKLTALALIVKLLQINTVSISDTIKLYLDYFPKKQFQLFFSGTGWQFLLLYLITVPVYVQLVKRSKLKLLTTLILLSIIWWGQKLIIDNTTPFRDQVIVLEVKPNNINEPWVDVTVEGRNFNELPFYGELFIGKQKQRIIKWSDREIIFRTNPTTTKTGGLYVKRSDNKMSNSMNFIYSGNR